MGLVNSCLPFAQFLNLVQIYAIFQDTVQKLYQYTINFFELWILYYISEEQNVDTILI